MTKALTKEMLEEYGITNIDWDYKENTWWINRYWHYGLSKTKKHKRIKISKAICKHKYTQDKVYPVVVFSYNSKIVGIPLGRLIYAWFKGPVPADMDIDHIDNDPFNNRLENLQLLTREENIRKRYVDNPEGHRNQFR